MARWVADLRLHSISGLPSEQSEVEVKVRYKAVQQPCSTASSFDGVVFLGAWTRLAVQEGEQELDIEVGQGFATPWAAPLLPQRPDVTAAGPHTATQVPRTGVRGAGLCGAARHGRQAPYEPSRATCGIQLVCNLGPTCPPNSFAVSVSLPGCAAPRLAPPHGSVQMQKMQTPGILSLSLSPSQPWQAPAALAPPRAAGLSKCQPLAVFSDQAGRGGQAAPGRLRRR